jgi:hypothetical protein
VLPEKVGAPRKRAIPGARSAGHRNGFVERF